MPTLTVATDLTWKGLDLEVNGSTTHSEPASWKSPGYDDGSWLYCVAASDATAYDIPGAALIDDATTQASSRTAEGIWLARTTFNMATAPNATPTLHLTCDNELVGVWLNGNLIGTLGDVDNWSADHTFSVSTGYFAIGENVLGVKIRNTAPSPAATHVQISMAVSYYATPGVWIDWAQDGFDDGTGSSVDPDHRLARMLPEAGSSTTVNDNITSDVVSFDWTRGAASDHVAQPPVGTCTIIVKNGATASEPGKYTPQNTGGSLYGKLQPNLPVWIGRNADGSLSGAGQSVYGVWGGYVRQIVPIPVSGAANTPTAEILCEDPLSKYGRSPTRVADAIGRSYTTLRGLILDDIGESSARRSLASEVDTMPLSAADSDNALSVLESINEATGSRHFIQVGDSKEDWYFYKTITRHHKLTSATDFSLNADNIQSSQGYRVTEENVNNYQVVNVRPAHLPAGSSTVWTYAETIFPLGSVKRTIWAQFDDFVTDAVINYTSTGGTVTSALTNFGTTAKIELWSASSSTVDNLKIEGRQVVRDADEAVTAEDSTSQATYGKRAGSVIDSVYVGTVALAQGVANFLVWRFGTAHPRLNVSIANLFSTLNDRELYDTVALTFDRLLIAGRRYEIIGEQGYCNTATTTGLFDWGVTYELQETANQSALHLFTLGTSTLSGSDVLAI